MRIVLLLVVALCLASCGDAPAPTETPGAGLSPRAAPLAVGDVAPVFAGLPDGPVVLIFYRGPW